MCHCQLVLSVFSHYMDLFTLSRGIDAENFPIIGAFAALFTIYQQLVLYIVNKLVISFFVTCVIVYDSHLVCIHFQCFIHFAQLAELIISILHRVCKKGATSFFQNSFTITLSSKFAIK